MYFYVFPVMIRIPISLNMLSGRCDGFYVFARDEMKENTSKKLGEKLKPPFAVLHYCMYLVQSELSTV